MRYERDYDGAILSVCSIDRGAFVLGLFACSRKSYRILHVTNTNKDTTLNLFKYHFMMNDEQLHFFTSSTNNTLVQVYIHISTFL